MGGNMRDISNLIDFPVSWSWHRYYETEQGRPDPGPNKPIPEPIKETRIEPEWTKTQWYYVENLRAIIIHLQTKLSEHLAEKQPAKSINPKESYKNIR